MKVEAHVAASHTPEIQARPSFKRICRKVGCTVLMAVSLASAQARDTGPAATPKRIPDSYARAATLIDIGHGRYLNMRCCGQWATDHHARGRLPYRLLNLVQIAALAGLLCPRVFVRSGRLWIQQRRAHCRATSTPMCPTFMS